MHKYRKDVRRLSGVDLKEHIISFDACGYSVSSKTCLCH